MKTELGLFDFDESYKVLGLQTLGLPVCGGTGLRSPKFMERIRQGGRKLPQHTSNYIVTRATVSKVQGQNTQNEEQRGGWLLRYPQEAHPNPRSDAET